MSSKNLILRLAVALLLTTVFFSANAAEDPAIDRIKGRVIENSTNQAIEMATVRLLNRKDSTLVTGTTTDKNGYFVLPKVKKGSYILMISFIGFESAYKNIITDGSKDQLNVGTIKLGDSTISLKETIIVGKANEVVVRNDTIEFNADSFKVTEGAVLEDLLKKMPGVEITESGGVKVNGKEIKKIMVDGKEFFLNDPKVATKNLPAQMVDKVQVMDRLSDMASMTGFDDGEEETILNLTVKKGMKQGWFGNAFLGAGNKDRYEGNAMVNRFVDDNQFTLMGGFNNTNNMGFSDLGSNLGSMGGGGRGRGGFGAGSGITSSANVGGNMSLELSDRFLLGGNGRYGYSDNETFNKSRTQNILNNGEMNYYNEESSGNTIGNNFGSDIRIEWKPNDKTHFIIRPEVSYNHTLSNYGSKFETLDNDLNHVNDGFSSFSSKGEGYNTGIRVDFSHKLNKPGRIFSASLSGGISGSYNNSFNYSETNFSELGKEKELIDQKIRYDNSSYNYRLFTSWVEPLSKKLALQLTYRISYQEQERLRNAYTKGNDNIQDPYNVLDTAYSKNYRNKFLNQRVGLAIKTSNPKYNITLGINVDPSKTKSINFIGDKTISEIDRDVFNFSPMARIKYKFSKQENLQVWYNGWTQQPSMEQLQPVADLSDPLNIRVGNPDLKPRYMNNIFTQYYNFNPLKQQTLMLMFRLSYTNNDIVSYSQYDKSLGKRTTTYRNVNGNWNIMVHGNFNRPLKNKRFSISNMGMVMYSQNKGFTNAVENISRNVMLFDRAGIDYRSDLFDIGMKGNVRYNHVRNTLQKDNNRTTWTYGGDASATLYLPLGFKAETDIKYTTNSGFSQGFDQNDWIWNASFSKTLFKNKQGLLRFKVYDILKQRKNISQTVTAHYIKDSEYNTLTSYFMVHFVYRFNIFKGGASSKDMKNNDYRHRRFFMGH